MNERWSQIRRRLMDWYDHRQREMPWRGEGDPYAVWVAEVMLQQTRVETVRPYYRRWMERFPTVTGLAAATMDDVLKAWEGLGYYARARNLHRAAQRIVRDHQGLVPNNWDDLRALPGIGDYTAGAVLSIAFGKPFPAVDGNVRRVLARLFAVESPIGKPAAQREMRNLAAHMIPPGRPGDFNQALMDLGAEVCLPRTPDCDSCPLTGDCLAFRQGRQADFPVHTMRRELPHYDMTAGVIWGPQRKVLMARRPWQGLLGGLWAFPGGKQILDESLESSLCQEIHATLGVRVAVEAPVATIKHAYTHFRITLHAFHCRYLRGKPQTIGCAEWKWMLPEEIQKLALPRTDQKILNAILGE
ncbi:MAG: A/G-specific adenine glycosylase [Chloroflexi bacterium]|nr:A/G-specific adenine glycosylase [Chloroflexota bacterium]